MFGSVQNQITKILKSKEKKDFKKVYEIVQKIMKDKSITESSAIEEIDSIIDEAIETQYEGIDAVIKQSKDHFAQLSPSVFKDYIDKSLQSLNVSLEVIKKTLTQKMEIFTRLEKIKESYSFTGKIADIYNQESSLLFLLILWQIKNHSIVDINKKFGALNSYYLFLNNFRSSFGLEKEQNNYGEKEFKFNKGITYFFSGDNESALKNFKSVIEMDDKHYKSYTNLSIIHSDLNYKLDSMTYLEKAEIIKPDDKTILLRKYLNNTSAQTMNDFISMRNDYEELSKPLEKLMSMYPEDTWYKFIDSYVTLSIFENPKQSEELLDKILEINDKSIPLWFYKGIITEINKGVEDAFEFYEKARNLIIGSSLNFGVNNFTEPSTFC